MRAFGKAMDFVDKICPHGSTGCEGAEPRGLLTTASGVRVQVAKSAQEEERYRMSGTGGV